MKQKKKKKNIYIYIYIDFVFVACNTIGVEQLLYYNGRGEFIEF